MYSVSHQHFQLILNRIAAASGTFNAFGSISCMLIVKRIWTCHMEFALYKLIIYHYISYQYNSPDLTDLMGILLSPRPQNQNSPGLLYLWKMLVLPVRLKRGRLCLGIVVLLGCILLLKWLTREAGQQTWVSVLLLTIFLSIVPGNWAAKPLLGCEASKHQNFPPKFEDKFKPN